VVHAAGRVGNLLNVSSAAACGPVQLSMHPTGLSPWHVGLQAYLKRYGHQLSDERRADVQRMIQEAKEGVEQEF
jgi:hypothetical protein